MSAIKFSCPTCGQNLEIAAEFARRQVNCPACSAPLLVPNEPAPKGASSKPKTQPLKLKDAQEPSKPSPPKPDAAAAVSAESRSADPVGKIQTAKIGSPRIAVLTPQVKLKIIRDVRARLKDKTRWLPGRKESGKYVYAARQTGGKLVPVEPTETTATHHSLFGAVLLEFHRQNVARVASGRRKFLDEELTEAIEQTLGASDGGDAANKAEHVALTHAQCMTTLDNLERRYEGEAKAVTKRKTESKLQRIRMADLVRKLEVGAPVLAESVACALYHELTALNQRLDKLEDKIKS